MAILLTNGQYYIGYSNTGGVIKVENIKEAYDFHTIERANLQKEKASRKCSGFYYIEMNADGRESEQKSADKSKRKNFSVKERLAVYRKTKGHCYLCGEFVDFDLFEIEHRIPISKGGTNDLNNLFCACHCCNSIKKDIYPKEFMDKITQIFMYQMGKRYGRNLKWKIICRLICR